MSRTPKINPAIAALDAEIEEAERTFVEHTQSMERARALIDALADARRRISGAVSARAPRAAKPWKPRGTVEKAIMRKLSDGPETAEELRLSTGAAAPSLKAALARMKDAGAVALGEGDRYSLAGVALQDAAQ